MRIPNYLRCSGWVLAIVVAVVSTTGWAAQDIISAIQFEGNDTTRPAILMQELTLAPGARYDARQVELSRQALMDLGLFRQVEARAEAGEEGTVLTFTVQEKYYLLPIPRLDAKPDGRYDYGLELRYDNLLGLNQSLKLTYLNYRTTQDDDYLRQETALSYRYPRILGSPFQLGLSFKRSQQDVITELDGVLDHVYRNTSRSHQLSLWRWLDARGPSRGWRAGAHLNWQKEQYSHLSGREGLDRESRAVSTSAFLEFYDVHEHPYYRSGQVYGYVTELGMAELGSDYNYTRNMLYWRKYRPLDIVARSNFDTQLRLGGALGERFGAKAFSIGGATTLRGYEADYDTGNGMALMNLEYYYHVSGYPQMRALLFADVGNVYADAQAIDLSDIRSSAGLGFRWRVQSFVNLTLAVDFAYAFETDSYVTYANTSGSF